MTVRDFNRRFGLKADPLIERDKFVTRINMTVFADIFQETPADDYDELFEIVCYELGIDHRVLIRNNTPVYSSPQTPSLYTLTNGDFTKTLKVLELVRKRLSAPRQVSALDKGIELALASATADIGVRWRDGMFYPAGAKELDEKLIGDNLAWLQSFPAARASFQTALGHFGSAGNDANARKDAITNAYTAIESLSRSVLGNTKNFDNNKDDRAPHAPCLPEKQGVAGRGSQ